MSSPVQSARSLYLDQTISLGAVSPAVMTGLVIGITYLAGPLPFYLATSREMSLTSETAIAGLVVTFLSAGVMTIALALATRQPLAVGWSMPGLIYMAAASQQYSLSAIAGAGVVAGIAVVVLALTGLAARLSQLIPAPVVLAVLAGSALDYCVGVFPAVAGAPVAGGLPVLAFYGARHLNRSWLPPLGAAVLAGAPVLLLAGSPAGAVSAPVLPSLTPVLPSLEVGAILSLAPILVVATITGNLQGFAVLEMNGFRPPRTMATAVMGGMSILHACFLAPPASMQRAGLVLSAGDGAGRFEYRYLAAVVASVIAIVLALLAVPADQLVSAIPQEYFAALVGLVMLSIVGDALQRSLVGEHAHVAFVAFAITLSGVTTLGLAAAFWGLAAGCVAGTLPTRSQAFA